jgi:uncharacterized protein (DUF3084 family)
MAETRVLGLFVLAGMLGGCVVPASRFEAVQGKLLTEQAALRRTQADLRGTRAELRGAQEQLRQAEARVRERERALEDAERLLAQSRLDISVVSSEREQAMALVEQLRGELARVGGYLTTYSDQKEQLSRALLEAETRLARLTEVERSLRLRVLVVRDLSLALYERISSGEYQLAVVEGRVELQVPADQVFASSAGDLHPEAERVFSALAAVAKRHGAARIRITETGGTPRTDQDEALRLKRVSDGLVAQGIGASDVTIDMPAPPGVSQDPAAPAPAVVSFAISTSA